MQPLPASLFPYFQEAHRSVHRDSYVEVEKAFSEAGWKPPESEEWLHTCTIITGEIGDAGYSDFFDFLAKVALIVWDDDLEIEREDKGGSVANLGCEREQR